MLEGACDGEADVRGVGRGVEIEEVFTWTLDSVVIDRLRA